MIKICNDCKKCKYMTKYYNQWDEYKIECRIPEYDYYKFIINENNKTHELYKEIKEITNRYMDVEKIKKFTRITGLEAKYYDTNLMNYSISDDFWKNKNGNCPFYKRDITDFILIGSLTLLGLCIYYFGG